MFPKPQKVGPLPPVPNPYRSRISGIRRRIRIYLPLVILMGAVFVFSIFPGIRHQIKSNFLDITAEVSQVLQKPVYVVEELDEMIAEGRDREKLIKELEAENVKLKEELMLSRQYFLQNQNLKKLLHVSQDIKYKYQTARIGSINHHMGTHRTYIESGEKSGVIEGQGVLNSDGALGRVSSIAKKHSEIQLFNDASSRIPVYLPRTGQHGILAGDGSLYPTLVYAVKAHEIETGDLIVTSNSGGVFVEGINVGRVVSNSGGIVRVELAATPKLGDFVKLIQNDDVTAEE